MIDVERFVARSIDRGAWLEARARGVTATMVARAATPAGFEQVCADIRNPQEVTPNAVMAWGSYREPFIAAEVKKRHGVMPNDWLICRPGVDNWQMATPDGLSLDHKVLGEYKTTGKPLDKIPIHYMRQMQWQMFVCDAEATWFAYELRLDGPDGFVPGFDVVTQLVERDEKMIRDLVEVAERVQLVNVFESWMEVDDE